MWLSAAMATPAWRSLYFSMIVFTGLSPTTVLSYPRGAPRTTCMTMFPKHGGSQTQLEKDVYIVQTDTQLYSPNSTIKVTISSPKGRLLMGVQVRAHRTEMNEEEIIGHFSHLMPAGKLRFMNCQGKIKNMVTQANTSLVDKVEMNWTAPNENMGPIIFEVTVVESYSVFFYGLKSAVVSPAPNSPTLTPPEIILSPVDSKVAPMDWGQCGESKGCLLYPLYCHGDNCKVAVSYFLNRTDDTVTFEMVVKGEEYISLGISADMVMGDDETISCCSVYDRVTFQTGWNHPFKFNVQEMRSNLTKLQAARHQDGTLYCRVTRPINLDFHVTYAEKEPLRYVTLNFNLNKDYYLFVAWGKTYQASDVLGYHDEMPFTSENKVDFSDHTIYRGSVMPNLIRAHSTMMAVAWMGFASLAIFIARYYKEGFDDFTICGIKIWFHIHRVSALLTFALTIAGLVVVLVYCDGKITKNETAHTHMCLGFTVVSLVIAQVFLGLVRPSPDHKLRPFFNFFHRLFGAAALIISAAALICAYKINIFTYDAQMFGERTVAVWAGAFVFLEVLHSGHQYLASKVLVHRSQSDQYNLDKASNDLEPIETGQTSNFLLAIFLIFIAFSITAAFIMTLFF